ncbi:MAG: hypothetical protein H8E59_01805 [Actinobacteria bacterium]|nr:hypothetical protein [Actinomycetota bacterium]
MRIRLRQVAFVAEDLAAVEADIEERLGIEACFRDPGVAGFGLHNVLYPVGDQLLEVVSPIEAGTAAGRLLDKRGGDGGYMVILQVDDLEPFRNRFAETRARVVFEAAADGVAGLHLHPADVGGAILSVDRTDDWDAWPWAGPDWRNHIRTDVVQGIQAVEIQAEEPTSMAARWSEVLGVPADGTTLPLDEGEIRFAGVSDDRGEGVSGLELAAAESSEVEISGVRITLVAQDR